MKIKTKDEIRLNKNQSTLVGTSGGGSDIM